MRQLVVVKFENNKLFFEMSRRQAEGAPSVLFVAVIVEVVFDAAAAPFGTLGRRYLRIRR